MLKRIAQAEAAIAFIDLQAQRRQIADEIDIAIARVLDHGQFILGKEVDAAEKNLSNFCGAAHTITCASGTDALALILMAIDVGPGDAVICPAFTFAAPAEVIALRGAVPIFADVLPKTFNIDPDSAKAAIDRARERGLQPKALIAVDLYGQPADYDELSALCDVEGLMLIDDAAQSFGATFDGRPTGTLAHATATSFFPAKPLGCYGDGGAIFTDDADLADRLRSLRMHGQGIDRYEHPRVGLNSRLDAIQAAILVEKLRIFPAEIIARGRVADRYNDAFVERLTIPTIDQRATSVWAQYTLRLGKRDRESFRAALQADGVPTAVHYPHALHRQEAYSAYPVAGGAAPMSDQLATEVVSLPMHPYLDEPTQDRVIASVLGAIE
ncbi:MAG: DegT/DnrJ/EryC1/StrS family aminotransferase [Alphaproteobacteria bacterium]